MLLDSVLRIGLFLVIAFWLLLPMVFLAIGMFSTADAAQLQVTENRDNAFGGIAFAQDAA